MPKLFDVLKGKGYNPYRGAGGRFTSGSGASGATSGEQKRMRAHTDQIGKKLDVLRAEAGKVVREYGTPLGESVGEMLNNPSPRAARTLAWLDAHGMSPRDVAQELTATKVPASVFGGKKLHKEARFAIEQAYLSGRDNLSAEFLHSDLQRSSKNGPISHSTEVKEMAFAAHAQGRKDYQTAQVKSMQQRREERQRQKRQKATEKRTGRPLVDAKARRQEARAERDRQINAQEVRQVQEHRRRLREGPGSSRSPFARW